ncbi:TSUP family transporter [Flavobacterium sediminilitoris]|uniref:Probable membrane transporter protein n=1 Tax=Flavobacterium sediminilitoris TaxID=2024526 RepID=A0ABY4HP08_9FLAO|nr:MULTISPECIES: TSUP family transporter [Flavobacterium]UOX34602.1 TSUP family transporter [Flavobacterium sediminilitoris]
MSNNTLFPVFLKTETAHFLIVGGGNVGLEKTETLLRQNSNIAITIVGTIIYPKLKAVIEKHSNIKSFERPFEKDDLDDIDFVIIGTDSSEVNLEVRNLAKERGIKVNAADQPALCDFYLGSIVNKGSVKIAISTNGKSPVLARRMREYFTEIIPDDIENSVESLNKFRANHKGSFQEKLNDLNKLTQGFESVKKEGGQKKYKRLVFTLALSFLMFFVGFGLSTYVSFSSFKEGLNYIPNEFYYMLLIGFIAQLIDGAVGLGYGVTCATSMMLLGVKLPAISGSIHTAEMFSSAISGYSHYKFGNVNKKMLVWLAIFGVLGAVLGAYLLIYLGNEYEQIAYVVLSSYTFIIGIRLLVLAFKKIQLKKKIKFLGFLGFSGGFMDAFGGGGWGPIVTSTLLAKGRKSKYVIGTVSLAEFFVTMSASIVFFTSLGVSHWYIILGLILGGIVAAPIAARLAGKLPKKAALILVAFLVIVFSIRVFVKII